MNRLPPVPESVRAFARQWAEAAATQALPPSCLRLECRRQGWGVPQVDHAIEKTPIRLNGKEFAHGLGTHADSEILLRAGQPMRRLRAWAGMDDNANTRRVHGQQASRLRFAVAAGGRELWQSPLLGVDSDPARLDLALEGSRECVLSVVDTGGNPGHFGHADWAGLEVELADGTVVRPESALASQALPDKAPVFAFRYGGRDVAELLPGWTKTVAGLPAAAGGAARRTLWRDPATGLECRLEMREFTAFAAVEWVLSLKNTGSADSPLIEDLQPLVMQWHTASDSTLRRSLGSPCTIADFSLRSDALEPGATIRMAAGGGRSSNAWLPFFNLQSGDSGFLAAIGWTGQWAAEFARNQGRQVTFRAGQELTHFVLHPGEEVRTPRMLLLFWQGEVQASHNLWRRLLREFYSPRPNGQPLVGPLTVAHWGGMKTPEHLERIEAYRREGLAYDYYWVDAGWYGPAESYSPDEFTGDWFKHAGNWTINPAAHPDGLRPIADAAAAAGMKLLLWVEPERAIAGTPLTQEHPDWFLGERTPGKSLLFNLGLPAARRWLTDYLSRFMAEQGVRLYRQDFNFDPLPYWREADAPDRQGISEIRHIEGLYAFWDELLARQPGLVIDNCASGGRRIDLETICRSIPLWRSDWQCRADNDPIGGQTHGMGLSYWVPFHGTGTWGSQAHGGAPDDYRVRSNYGPAFQFSLFPYAYTPIRADYPWDWHRARLAEYRRARPLFLGDYYPLTPFTTSADAWAVAQFDRPDLGEGLLLAFRRGASPFLAADFRLAALDAKATYELTDADAGRQWQATGAELATQGLRLEMPQAPASRLIFYRRLQ